MMLTASATVASTDTDAASGSQSSRTLIKDLHPVVRPDWTQNYLEVGYYDLPGAAVKGVGHKKRNAAKSGLQGVFSPSASSLGLQMGHGCRRCISRFQNGQPCFSDSCWS